MTNRGRLMRARANKSGSVKQIIKLASTNAPSHAASRPYKINRRKVKRVPKKRRTAPEPRARQYAVNRTYAGGSQIENERRHCPLKDNPQRLANQAKYAEAARRAELEKKSNAEIHSLQLNLSRKLRIGLGGQKFKDIYMFGPASTLQESLMFSELPTILEKKNRAIDLILRAERMLGNPE